MDKIKISLSSAEWTKLVFQEQEIMVTPYISSMNRNVLSKVYIETLYSNEYTPDEGFFYAENSLILGILEYCTNINIFTLSPDDDEIMDLDKIISSGLWDAIKSQIKNYDVLYDNILNMVNRIDKAKGLEKSLGSVMEFFIQKLEGALGKLSDLDTDKLGNLLDKFKEESTNLDKMFTIPPDELLAEKKPRKKRVSKKESLD